LPILADPDKNKVQSAQLLTESAYAKTPWPGVVLLAKTIYLCKFRSIL